MCCRVLQVALSIVLFATASMAEPIVPGAIEVVDGDTIRARGMTVRLIGYDTPEAGNRASCEAERNLAAEASNRLRQLIGAGGLDLTVVACNCRPGTEGTQACNHGRSCGVLTVAKRDVGLTLIGAGLARPYHCTGFSCPRRQSWCEPESSPQLAKIPSVTSHTHFRKTRGGCGSRGGAGYRLASGKCASRKR
jgi:endonuclease YncB( thermonuclease family)